MSKSTDNKGNSDLEARLAWLERVLYQALGASGPWMVPKQASHLVGVSAEWLVSEIKLAEAIRIIGKKPHLIYGVHYTDIQGSVGTQNRWKVNVTEISKFLKMPPEERKPSAEIIKLVSDHLQTA
jgi:hypothetical protein